jgi:hypothetical protein
MRVPRASEAWWTESRIKRVAAAALLWSGWPRPVRGGEEEVRHSRVFRAPHWERLGDQLDGALAAGATHVEHYEIATYEGLLAHAEAMGQEEPVRLTR